MFSSKKLAILVVLMMVAPIVIAACGPTPEPEVIVKTEVVEKIVTEVVEVEQTPEVVEKVVTEVVEVTVPPPTETPVPEAEAGPYRIALFEDPVSTNYWNYLGPGSSVWTSYIVAGQAPQLYSLADVTFQFVPYLAKEIVEPVQEGDLWVLEVPMVEDAVWSDGESITAHDVVFTQNACRDLKLTQNWPNQCWPGLIEKVEAVDDYTVRFYYNEPPSLGTWQAGAALAPILPEHFWADLAVEAYAFVEGVEEPEVDHPADCGEDMAEEDAEACEAWAPVDEAHTNARRTLYEADATGAPSGGGYITDKLELGAFAQRTANGEYYLQGAEIVEYEDGTWMLNHPNGTTYQLYGDAAGEETLRFEKGPYAPNIIFSIYGSQDAAFLALADGEVDYVLNPLGLAKGLQEQALKGEGIESYVNADYGMYYLAFNMRKYPMSEYEFRQAVDAVIDKEFVVNSVLGGVVFPMYSTMPPGNEFWFNPEAEANPYTGLSREERVNEAVKVLTEAGWSWDVDPAWNEDTQDVDPGQGITMPNGEPMQDVVILGPGPAYDPLRATFNQWISEWCRELGMPVESELTGFNTILGPVFVDADFDMYILGWSLGNVAFPDYFEAFWHSRNDTAVSGNYNTPGFNNADYDALVDEFMSTADLERARELVYEMQVVLADQRPYIPLFYKQTIDLARDTLIFPYTDSLGGLEFQAGMQTDTYPMSK
ncbi:MAG: ABC transporter substrate-binding protein [Anaerolineae bacterium]